MKVVRGEAQNYSWESAPAAALSVSSSWSNAGFVYTFSHVLLQSSSINFGTFLCDVTFSFLFFAVFRPSLCRALSKVFCH